MARLPPGNLNSRGPDHGFDNVAKQSRFHDFEKVVWDVPNPRGGGGGWDGGRSEYVRCCFGCGEPGHIIRDCPNPTSGSFARNDEQSHQSLKNKVAELEEAKDAADSELKKLKLESQQWKNKVEAKDAADSELKKLKLESQQWKNKVEEAKDAADSELKKLKLESQQWKNKVEEAKDAADSELKKLKLESQQWRKAAKSVSLILDGNVGVSSKSLDLECLVLYYSNRAAKRMSLGKIRKAVDDCRMAARLDPNFLKVCVTAGNCNLALGEMDDAGYNYKKCLESGVVNLDTELTTEASNGIQNVEQVVYYINQSAELLRKKTSKSATSALQIITKALLISPHSEKLLEMKGEALFMLKKYDEVVQMCKQTISFAEKNCATINHISDEERTRPLKLWRWRLMCRSYFCMASFDMAQDILEKYEQLEPAETKTEGPSSFSTSTISELLHCKTAGFEAFKAKRYREAVEHYSNALQISIVSRSFTAICLYNRAVAHQALGEVVDAIADCNLVIALDGNNHEAYSRRARLYEKIKDYEHAALDLLRLITLLEERKNDNKVKDLTIARQRLSSTSEFFKNGTLLNYCPITVFGERKEDKHDKDLSVAHQRLSSTSKFLKKGTKLDYHLILRLKGSESAPEIRKAYDKATLKHHPDKAGKLLVKCENEADRGVWKEIFETIHKDADKLFRMIQEAYDVLSEANKVQVQ